MSLREDVKRAKTVYEVVLRSTKPADDAPLDEQHRWWRAHDALKRAYAVADWKWESLLLRTAIMVAAVLAAGAIIIPQFIPLTLITLTFGLWRGYVIFTRSAPD